MTEIVSQAFLSSAETYCGGENDTSRLGQNNHKLSL